jgi:hypothetical protein
VRHSSSSNPKRSSLRTVVASVRSGAGRAVSGSGALDSCRRPGLIRCMSEANPRWGAPRIHGELLKLGVDVCQATVATYRIRHRRPPSQTWRTFLANHVGQIVAADFFVPTATGRLLFVLVMLAHQRRRVIHMAVTDHPTGAWTGQQLREAFPLGSRAAVYCPGSRSCVRRRGGHGEGDAN